MTIDFLSNNADDDKKYSILPSTVKMVFYFRRFIDDDSKNTMINDEKLNRWKF